MEISYFADHFWLKRSATMDERRRAVSSSQPVIFFFFIIFILVVVNLDSFLFVVSAATTNNRGVELVVPAAAVEDPNDNDGRLLDRLLAEYAVIKRQHRDLFTFTGGAAGGPSSTHNNNNSHSTSAAEDAQLGGGNFRRRKRASKVPYSDVTARNQFFPTAAAAYGDQKAIERCLVNWFGVYDALRWVSVDKCAGKEGHVCSGYTAVLHTQKAIVVAFRGTASTEQLLFEASTTLSEKQPDLVMGSDHVGKVGWYFYTAFMQLWGSQGMVLEVVKLRSKYPNYAIWVTGHSLGGALAVIAAVFIYHEVLHQKETTAGLFLFTMGEPRVGDPDFASHIDRVLTHSTYRVVHKGDIVVTLPPLSDKFRHHSTEIWYEGEMVPEIPQVTFDAAGDDKQHSIHQCAEADGDSRCSYGLNAANASVADHSGYFGQTAVSTFGIAGCPNPACESQSSTLKGQIEAAQRQMISTILQQILSSKPAEQLGPLIEVRRLLQNLLGTYNRLPCVQQQQQH